MTVSCPTPTAIEAVALSLFAIPTVFTTAASECLKHLEFCPEKKKKIKNVKADLAYYLRFPQPLSFLTTEDLIWERLCVCILFVDIFYVVILAITP